MEFFEKYKSYILSAVAGAVIAIVLSTILRVPFWITGAIIGASAPFVNEWAVKTFDQQRAKYEAKRAEKKSKESEE